MSSISSPHQFPSAIRGKLQSIRLRHAAISLTFAVVFAGAAWLILMVAAMAIDWMYPFASTWLRIVLTGTTAVASLSVACWLGVGPVRHALQWVRAASAVDADIPELEERWSTVTSLSARDASKLSSLERAMAAQVTSEAIAMERIVLPNRVEPPVSLRPAIVSAVTAAGFIAILFALAPQQTSILMRRFFSPTQALTATQLDSITGDKVVPRGEIIDVVVAMQGVPRSFATLTIARADGREQDYRLRPDEATAGQFSHSLRVDESMSYRVRAGDAQTPWHRLHAIDYPELGEVRLTIEFPEYTGRASVERDRFPSQIQAVQGSVLRLAFKPVDPLKRCAVLLSSPSAMPASTSSDQQDAATTEHPLKADEDSWYHCEIQLVEDLLLRPVLVSPHGLENRRRQFTRIDVIADKAPVARVVKPTDEVAVAEDATIEIEFEAHDDHGIATAELVIFDESQRDAEGNAKVLAVQSIDLDEQAMQPHVMGKAKLDLKQLGLSEGQQISYAVRVTDNRDLALGDGSTASPHTTLAQQMSEATADTALTEPATKRAPELERSSKALAAATRDTNQGDDLATQMLLAAAAKESAEPASATSEAGQSDSADSSIDPAAKRPTGLPAMPADAIEIADSGKADSDRADSDNKAVKSPQPAPATAASTNPAAIAKADSGAVAPSDPDAAAPSDPDTTNDATDESASARPEEAAGRNTVASSQPPASDATTTASRQQPAASPQDETTPALPGDKVASGEPTPQPMTDPNPMPLGNQSRAPVSAQASTPSSQTSTPPMGQSNLQLTGLQSTQGQNTFSDRRRLKITATLSAIAEAKDRPGEERSIRETVVEIDRMLAAIEADLQKLVDHAIVDADRGEQWKRLDISLGNVETFVADLREQTKENQFAFVGLQMVDITRTHVTPARDRVFAGAQRPTASDVDAKMALQHVMRARELLAALLKRYDRVEQETKLKEEMDEAITMYDVYVKKRTILMREARQNLNPLDRKMGIIEVDQAYLDRLAEVLKLRREMMEEFAQMLGDDPRLLSRYMELTKRRRSSLRDQLTEISQRQFDMTEETLNWLEIDDSQREDLWSVIIDLRLAAADDLAKDASELSERVEKQMPLEVELAAGTPAQIIAQAKQIASAARTIRMDADDVAAEYGKANDPHRLQANADSLVVQCERLFSLLDRLQFENSGNAGLDQYVEARIQESRAVADQANLWANLSSSIARRSYPSVVESEQHRLAISTQLLRVNMLEMESDLVTQFQQLIDSDLPGEIKDRIRRLHRLMEAITFNQLAAAFRLGQGALESAAKQQQLASDRLAEAESWFDEIRRAVVERLDENDPDDPNIADLQDPALDAFLAQLEREPNIAAQLGIPNRRTNLRIRADSGFWQQSPQSALAMAADAAGERAREAMKMQRDESDPNARQGRAAKPEDETGRPAAKELSEAEKKQREEAKRAQDELAQRLAEIEKQQENRELPADQRERLEQMAKELRKLLEPPPGDESAEQAWQRIVQADQAEELMRAVAAGKPIADDQWNRLMSTLDDGLWQTRGDRPPEAYRKAIEQYQDQIRELMPTIDEP
ncbi:MAG: hypothetical protein ACO1RT_17285 [Planctomycetaceae bacterium]